MFNDILKTIQKELKIKEDVQEELMRDMRKATRLSKQAIFLVHQERFEEAETLLEQASMLFSKLREVSSDYPDLIYRGFVYSAFEENAEAHAFINLVRDNRYIDPNELGIPHHSYILGVADVIGEFRRRALDMIRKGNEKEAERCLQTMEYIYGELINMDDALILINGLRLKCDVARNLIEITRGDVTNDVRRSSLENRLKKLEKFLEKA